ncbi:hypothetical protein AQF52_5065 [Streptomyces venezuelae]|uniref:DUF397 domain-containing protein n=1 Tax=Streptomyces gardneri TaxID=66892 RepID=UPI0006BD74D3|nr:DUF397 domain-containing protein [Streptomyces gardneri]ALO10659.1 hypothetical protein AQF52_5065 [Streptomyces venezuelae]QPK47642.1 DUF397 domain-containing protein [Streptomyces gardneri]WRK39085.1 DUF397 domain-containing protein [Streptomyces venezuelae]CUM38864.1 hypothetical protein BN2537_6693 [Streptomyces venezuelae]
MTEPTPNWHKSTYSGADNDACIEVADNLPRVLVRDTKDHAKGELTATPGAWAAFTAFARTYAA